MDTRLNCARMSGLTKSFTAVLFAINSHCLVFMLAKSQIMALSILKYHEHKHLQLLPQFSQQHSTLHGFESHNSENIRRTKATETAESLSETQSLIHCFTQCLLQAATVTVVLARDRDRVSVPVLAALEEVVATNGVAPALSRRVAPRTSGTRRVLSAALLMERTRLPRSRSSRPREGKVHGEAMEGRSRGEVVMRDQGLLFRQHN